MAIKVFLAQAALHCRNTSPARVSSDCVTPVVLTWILLITVKDLKRAKNRRGGFVSQQQLKKLVTSLVQRGGRAGRPLNTSVQSSLNPWLCSFLRAVPICPDPAQEDLSEHPVSGTLVCTVLCCRQLHHVLGPLPSELWPPLLLPGQEEYVLVCFSEVCNNPHPV